MVKKSIIDELQNMVDYKCFTPTDVAIGNTIRSSLFLKEKFNNGIFQRLKSRLVAGGDWEWVNNNTNLYSPTVYPITYNTIIQDATNRDLIMEVFDVKSAYLNAELKDKDITMILDKLLASEYIKLVPNASVFLQQDGSMYVKINKAIYGLKESALLWYQRITKFLLKYINFITKLLY